MITLWVIITVSFFIIRIAPGGPFDTEKQLPQKTIKALEKKYKLDKSLIAQYWLYVKGIIRGDFGPSLHYERNINFYIASSFPHSLLLGTCALLLILVVGLIAGLHAALHHNRWQDYCTITATSIGYSLPLFVLGPLLVYVMALTLKILPTSGWITSRFGWKTMVMPLITLSLPYIANITRLTRASAIDVLQSDYVRTAFSKGLPMSAILIKHVLKGVLLPVISYCAPVFASLATGSVVIERIFRIPGIGQLFTEASFNRDYPMVMSIIIIYSSILIVANFLVDLVYNFLDPRIINKQDAL